MATEAGDIILIYWSSLMHREEYLMMKKYFLSRVLNMGPDTKNSVHRGEQEVDFQLGRGGTHFYQ